MLSENFPPRTLFVLFALNMVASVKVIVVVLVVLIPSCLAFSTHAPTTVCEEMKPHHDNHGPKPHNTSPYTLSVSPNSYTINSQLNITIAGALFHGFMIQARRVNTSEPPYPIGTFKNPLPDKTTQIWCSGGEPMNTVSHKHPSKVNFTSVHLTWQAPGQGAGDIRFYLTIVQKFDIYWAKVKSNVISGPAAPPAANISLQADFQITKQGCGVTKGCYSEPPSCKDSIDCTFLLTYKDTGDNVTFEISSMVGYGSVGFNSKQEMNNTDAIFCSKLATSEVVVRSYFLDYHQPLRHDLRSSSIITPLQSAYNNGVVKCRFSRKKAPQKAKMLDLSKNWYFIFAWGHVSSTGQDQYHRENASYSNATVDIRKNLNLVNGRPPKTVPTPTPGKVTKTGCGKTKGCYSEPRDCKSSDDCDYLLTYQSDKTKITFEMSAKTDWVAVGFNSKAKMDGTDALICSREGSNVQIAHYDIKNYNPPIKNNQGSSSLKDSTGKFDGGVLQCKTSRNLKQPGMMDLSERVFLIFARGPTSGSQIQRHTHKSSTVGKVDVSSTENLEAAGKNIALIRAHAALMSIAWLLFASLGMFIARYMKPIFGEILDKKGWFQFHRLLMVSTLLFSIVGIILAFVYLQGWTEAYVGHAAIGIVVLVLALIQPIMALFRPGPGDDKRYLFNYAHRSVGLLALILAVVNCFLGVGLPQFKNKEGENYGLYPLIVYCCGVALVLVFEIVLLVKSNKGYDMDQPKAAMKNGKVEVETRKLPPQNPENNKSLKIIMFGFVTILVIGCCLALIILIARDNDDD